MQYLQMQAQSPIGFGIIFINTKPKLNGNDIFKSAHSKLNRNARPSLLSSNLSIRPYHYLKLVSFLRANRTKSASVCPWLLRGAVQLQILKYITIQYNAV